MRRILDDTELGEETKTKLAIEKVKHDFSIVYRIYVYLVISTLFPQERQERLKSLEGWNSTSSKSPVVSNGLSHDGTEVEKPGDYSSGYIINLLREEGEEAVFIPPSISKKLKPHQVSFQN